MKKLLLAVAITSLSLHAAQAAPTLYGKVNVSIDQFNNKSFGSENVTEVNSKSSRIGVKGEYFTRLKSVFIIAWMLPCGISDDTIVMGLLLF